MQTALVCDPLYKLLKKLLFYTQSATPSGGKNEMEIAKIGTEIKRMLPTCAKLAEVFGEILHQKVSKGTVLTPFFAQTIMVLTCFLGRPTYGV